MAGGNDNSVSFAQRIRIRLFLEGVEVPVIAANISASPNSPSVCSLQIPPLVQGTRLLPRTLVHVFFQDAYEVANPFLLDSATAGKEPTENASDPTQQESLEQQDPTQVVVPPAPCGDTRPKDWTNRRYKLCFVGELVGFTWTKNPMSRSLMLQCEDLSNYWDYAYQWSNSGIFGPGLKAMFSGGATNLFTDFLTSQGSQLASIVLSGKCNTFPKLKGLAAGIVRLVESVGGSYYTPPDSKGLKKFAGQNFFFSIAELRLHVTQMITAYEDDPTSKRLLSRQGYGGMFNRVLGGLGQQVSIRKAMVAITRIMFHETYAQPCPYYKKGTGTDPSGNRRVAITSDPNLSIFASLCSAILKVITDLEDQLSLYRELTLEEFKQNSQGVEGVLKDARTKVAFQEKLIKQLTPRLSKAGAPRELEAIYAKSAQQLGLLKQELQGKWAPRNSADKRIQSTISNLSPQLDRASTLTVNRQPLKERSPSRLVQQILRPDIWFGAPPRCNVLFPDMYTNISYQRMFLQEPTRFMLKTNDEFFGEDFLFDKFYFAPQAGSLKKNKANLQDMLRNDLLDHELFTGILPVFEKMGEFNVFAARSNREQKGAISKVSFAQRSANFLYFKHRFNARQFQVSARFNPYVAAGFPGLIIDKWVDSAAAEKIKNMRDTFGSTDPDARNMLLPKYTKELIGANFLANFVEVSHSLSQASLQGTTNIRCNYARQVGEGVEFLGAGDKTEEVQRRQEGDARRTSIVAAISPPDLHSLGPNQGAIVGVQEVTDKYLTRDIDSPTYSDSSGQSIPVFFSGGSLRREGGQKYNQLKVPVGVRLTPADLPGRDNALLTEFLGSSEREVVFRAYSVDEDIPRYRREEVELPPEELIRPGWYGDVWSPGKIGKVYQDFFGIGSITEKTVVLDGGPNANEEFMQAASESETAQDVDNAVADLPLVTSLKENATIEQAVEFLTLTYSYVKSAGLDADEFIRAYTWRPIASMIDMFGDEKLEFDSTGTAATQGVEGFHSRAFGPYNDLFGLVAPDVESVLGIDRGSPAAQKGDTRLKKREAVLALQAALSFGTAQVG